MFEKPIFFKLEIQDETVRRDLESTMSSINGLRRLQAGETQFCDLLIFEIAGETKKGFQYVSNIQQSGTVGEMFLTSRQADPEVLIAALRAGIKEFISQPVRREDVLAAVTRFRARKEDTAVHEIRTKGPSGKIIAITGSKGGVGTTTVAVNLATSLMAIEDIGSVLLLDLNPLFGETPVFMGIAPPISSWFELTSNISRVDSVYLMSILHKHPSGIHVLPAPAIFPEEAPSPEALATLFKLFRSLFDFIIVDNGRSLGNVSRSVMSLSDTILLVCNLNLSCVINTKRLQDTITKLDFPGSQIEIIINRYQKGSRISPDDIEENLNRKVLAMIPNDYRIAAGAITQGKPLSLLAHDTNIAKSFRTLAYQLAGKTEREKEKIRLFRLK